MGLIANPPTLGWLAPASTGKPAIKEPRGGGHPGLSRARVTLGFFARRGRKGRPVLPRFAIILRRGGLRWSGGRRAQGKQRVLRRGRACLSCAAGRLCCCCFLVALHIRWPGAFPSGPSSDSALGWGGGGGVVRAVGWSVLLRCCLLSSPAVHKAKWRPTTGWKRFISTRHHLRDER